MTSRFGRNPAVESSPLQDELMLFHGDTGKFCILNRTSTSIWTYLEAPNTAAAIAAALARDFEDVEPGDALRDTESALAEMEKLGLVVRL